MNKTLSIVGGAALVLLASAAVRHVLAAKDAKAAPGAKRALIVEAVMPVRRDMPVVLQAGGNVTPLRMVEVRARLASTVRQVHVTEGQFVHAGDLLFSLDDRGERAEIDKAQAQVARDDAVVAELERQHGRNQDLLTRHFIAQSAVESVQSQLQVARASLASGRAGLSAARIHAGYGRLRAPMDGRIGAIDVHPGSLLQPTTSLTTITQLHPNAVTFSLPESMLQDVLAAQARAALPVTATTGTNHPAVAGTLRFLDSAVDRATGSIRAKAWFDNRGNALWPGQYVNVRMTARVLRGACVVPQAALVPDGDGVFVYVVQKDSTVRRVPVRRLHADGADVAVSGIDGTEAVVTGGIQNLHPGAKVAPVAAAKESRPAPATAGSVAR
jgi:membrane fusion protein, multidrug efflux system